MYLAGVSVRRVEDITEALWGTGVSPGTVSNLNKKIYVQIEAWRNKPIEGKHPLSLPITSPGHIHDEGRRDAESRIGSHALGSADEWERLWRATGVSAPGCSSARVI